LGKETRCPYCLDDLVGVERVVRCVSCRTPHHAVCFDEHGGCVAFGCGGVGAADAGQSIMLRKPKIELGARWREVPLFPLVDRVVRFRPAKRIDDEDHASAINPWVRISLEQEKLYPGQDLKARVVVALTRDTVVRRLEVRIFDEPLDPDDRREPEPRLLAARILGRQPLAMGTLVRSMLGLAKPYSRLRPGLHPYQVEVPRLFGAVIPAGATRLVQIGVVLERQGEQTVASPRVTVEAVPIPARVEPALARVGAGLGPFPGEPAHAVILRAGENILTRNVWFDEAEPSRVVLEGPPPPFDLGAPRGGLHDLELGGIDQVAPSVPPVPLPHFPPMPRMGPVAPLPEDDLIAPPREGEPGTSKAPLDHAQAIPAVPLVDPFAPAANEFDPFAAGSQVVDPFAPGPPDEDPFADPFAPAKKPEKPAEKKILVRQRDSRRVPRVEDDAWSIFGFRSMTTAGPRTGRVVRARFMPRNELPPLRLSVEVPPRNGEEPLSVLDFTIDAPHPLEILDLACRYELQDKHGQDLALGNFPLIEEVGIVGERALDRKRTGKDERIALAMPIDPFLLEESRSLRGPAGEIPVDLVVRIACEGFDAQGSKATSGTRVVRISLGRAAEGNETGTAGL
jgi:hypothetical protein